MKTKLALSAIVAAVAVFSQGAFAQASSPSRAAVKAETKAALKAHEGVPMGQAEEKTTTGTKSKLTRAERKAKARADLKAHKGEPMGEAGSMKSGNTAGSTASRAERKAKTKAAVKAGAIPMGEAPKN